MQTCQTNNYARYSPEARPEAVLAARELARRNFIDFVTYTYPQYIPEAFHISLADALERVLRKEIKRLMVFAPPQHGKSELISVRFPSFYLAHNPRDPVILTSYAASLAFAQSRKARNVMESSEYQLLFPYVRPNPAHRAIDEWTIQKLDRRGWAGMRGGVKAAGAGGGITGHGAALAIIDDPIKGWAEAQSRAAREGVWDWYRSVLRSRVWQNGAIVLVMTRWHEDDLAGKLLAQEGDKWTVLRYPALAETPEERAENNKRLGIPDADDLLGREPGAPLCPKRFSRETLLETKATLGSLMWNTQYQGVPMGASGGLFKREWLVKFVDAPPEEGVAIRYWDRAATMGEGDYTVGVKMTQRGGLYYIADVVRGQWSAIDARKVIRSTAILDGSKTMVWVEQEGGSGGKESAEDIVRFLAGFNVHTIPARGDKASRALPFAAQFEAGNVYIVRGKWNGAFIDELLYFPQGRHDDQVDAASGAFNRLASLRNTNYIEYLKRAAGQDLTKEAE